MRILNSLTFNVIIIKGKRRILYTSSTITMHPLPLPLHNVVLILYCNVGVKFEWIKINLKLFSFVFSFFLPFSPIKAHTEHTKDTFIDEMAAIYWGRYYKGTFGYTHFNPIMLWWWLPLLSSFDNSYFPTNQKNHVFF